MKVLKSSSNYDSFPVLTDWEFKRMQRLHQEIKQNPMAVSSRQLEEFSILFTRTLPRV